MTLEQNYRGTQPILKATNHVIGLAKERFTKNLWSIATRASRPAWSSAKTKPTRPNT